MFETRNEENIIKNNKFTSTDIVSFVIKICKNRNKIFNNKKSLKKLDLKNHTVSLTRHQCCWLFCMGYLNLLDQKDIFHTNDFDEATYFELYFEQIMKCKEDKLIEKVTFTLNETHRNEK